MAKVVRARRARVVTIVALAALAVTVWIKVSADSRVVVAMPAWMDPNSGNTGQQESLSPASSTFDRVEATPAMAASPGSASGLSEMVPIESLAGAFEKINQVVTSEVEAFVNDKVSHEVAVEMIKAAEDNFRIHESMQAQGLQANTAKSCAYLYAIWPDLSKLIADGTLPCTIHRARMTRADINNGSVLFDWTVGEDEVHTTFITPNWTVKLTLSAAAGQGEVFEEVMEAYRLDHEAKTRARKQRGR